MKTACPSLGFLHHPVPSGGTSCLSSTYWRACLSTDLLRKSGVAWAGADISASTKRLVQVRHLNKRQLINIHNHLNKLVLSCPFYTRGN